MYVVFTYIYLLNAAITNICLDLFGVITTHFQRNLDNPP